MVWLPGEEMVAAQDPVPVVESRLKVHRVVSLSLMLTLPDGSSGADPVTLTLNVAGSPTVGAAGLTLSIVTVGVNLSPVTGIMMTLVVVGK